jgi:hypothetical protein
MTNEEIMARCRAMRNGKGEEFRALYDTPAKEKGKEDRSTIDWRLLLKLAWWTQDEDQLLELMEGSARKRDEWGARHGSTTKLRYDVRRCIAKTLASGKIYKEQPDQQDGARGWTREELDALPEAVAKDMLWSIYNVSMHPDLTPSDSRVAIAAWFLSRQFPGLAGDQEMMQLRRKDIATACHLSENTAGDILAHSAEVGLLTREPRRRKDGHIDLYVGAASRVILTTEPIARSSRRKADVARKQCKHCKQSCYVTQKWCRCGMKLDETAHGDDQDLVAALRDEIAQKQSVQGWEYGFETVGGPPKRAALPYVPLPPTPSIGHLTVFWATELVMDPAAQITQPALYSHYRTWCIEHNEDADDRVTFEAWITAQGATLEEGTWHGIGLATTSTDGAGCSPDPTPEFAYGFDEPDPTLESAVGQADYEKRAEVLTGEGAEGGPGTDSGVGRGGEMDTETPFGATGDKEEEPGGCTSDPMAPQPSSGSAAGFTGRRGKPTRLQVYVHPDTDLEWDAEEPTRDSAPVPSLGSASVLLAPSPPAL